MTAPLNALARLLPRAFAVFLVLHGLVHVVGFTNPWGLGAPKGVEYSTAILNGSVEVGDAGVKALGFVWLAAVAAFVVVGAMVWRGHPWARRATVAVTLGSLALCAIGLPNARYGLAIDVAVLAALAVASGRLFVSPAGRAAGSEPQPSILRP
jgi:hypothetical protein